MAAAVTKKRLSFAWGLLVLLTLVTIVGGRAETGAMAPLGMPLFGLLMVVTAVKAQQILSVYLGLSTSSPGWRAGFAVAVWGLCGLIWGIYVLDQWI